MLRRLSRQRVLGLTVGALTVALVVVACGGGAPTATPRATATPGPTATPQSTVAPTPTTAALPTATAAPPTPTPTPFAAVGQPKYGGTFRVGGIHFRADWDPHINRSPSGVRDYSRMLFNGLVRFDQRAAAPKPDLAESWTLDGQGNVTFKLVKGVRWHNRAPVNGRELTAEDIKWSMDRAITNPKSIVKHRFATLEEVQVIDAETIRFVMKQPDANLFFHLGFEQVVILPQEAAVDGGFSDPRAVIGSGPFLADLLVNPGLSRFVRNPDYWRKDAAGRQLPFLDSVEYLMGAADGVVSSLMKARELDLAPIRNADNLKYFATQPGTNIQDTTGVIVGNLALFFNVTMAPFDDIRLREAVHLIINRQDLIDIVYGGLAYLTGPLGANASMGHWPVDQLATFPGLRPDKTEDHARAKQLLQDAGVPNGFSFTVATRSAQLSNEQLLLQQQLEAFGIEMKGDLQVENAGFTEVAARNQATWLSAGGGTTPDHAIENTFLRESPKNASNWFNDEMEALYLKELSEFDVVERFKLLDRAQQLVLNDHIAAWSTRPTTAWVSWDWLKNFARPDHGYNIRASQFDEVWIDRG